jgi:tetratricopeptide (TPR) repeat protein
MIELVQQLIIEYKKQLKADPATADKTLPEQACRVFRNLIAQQLNEGFVTKEAAHLANDISYFFGGDKNNTVQVLTQYLTQPLESAEEAWARWQLADNLAMLRRCEEVVDEQKKFLIWAKRNLSPDRLLWVMSDSTQAFCWVEVGQGAAWLETFEQVVSEVPLTRENRYDRFIYLRTANRVYLRLGRLSEAWQTCEEMETLSHEDVTWEKSFAIKLESFISRITLCDELNDCPKLRQLGVFATTQLREYHAHQPVTDFKQRRELSSLYHNLAASLYFKKQYDLAIPLLRSAIEIGVWEHYCYSWLAASLWTTNKDKRELLPLLRKASERVVGEYTAWQHLPELQEIATDTELLRASGLLKN